MNRPGVAPQGIRGVPGFGGPQQQQQQQQQPGRSVSNRLPNGKLAAAAAASNGSGWAFGSGSMPGMGAGNLPNPSRQLGGNVSFAQSLGGSQPSTPLDLSEFPSLSNSSQLGSANAPSMWSTAAGSRAVSGPVPRNQPTPLSAAQSQEEMYPPAQARQNFRFGTQPQQGQQQQQPPSNPPDEFPPLNRNGNGGGNGEIGGERSGNLMSSLGFNTQSGASAAAAAAAAAAVAAAGPSSRVAGNGLLNAISANNRSSDAPSASTSNPPGLGRPTDEQRKIGPLNADDSPSSQERRHASGTIGSDGTNGKATEGEADVNDPLAGMAPIDKFGIKGLQTMMANFPAYGALIQGMDPTDLGLNLSSPDPISSQVYSLFDDTPPRPPIPSYNLPECYKVNNVQPIETKISSFNEETLFWIFYSCPQDIKQQLAAYELHARNWRWHKKLHIWLTKDDMMTPQSISPSQEQGYYVVWDTRNWRKERREMTLFYEELDTTLSARNGT